MIANMISLTLCPASFCCGAWVPWKQPLRQRIASRGLIMKCSLEIHRKGREEDRAGQKKEADPCCHCSWSFRHNYRNFWHRGYWQPLAKGCPLNDDVTLSAAVPCESKSCGAKQLSHQLPAYIPNSWGIDVATGEDLEGTLWGLLQYTINNSLNPCVISTIVTFSASPPTVFHRKHREISDLSECLSCD